MECKYALMENTLVCGKDSRVAYGIAYVQIADGIVVVLKSVSDVSTDRHSLERLIYLCNELNLDPIHLNDILEDYFATV